jgi:hypothetical protein
MAFIGKRSFFFFLAGGAKALLTKLAFGLNFSIPQGPSLQSEATLTRRCGLGQFFVYNRREKSWVESSRIALGMRELRHTWATAVLLLGSHATN